MGDPADEAAQIPAPKAGNINVVAVGDTSTAAIDLGITGGTVWHTFQAQTSDIFIVHDDATGMAAASATATSGDTRTWMIPANTEKDYKVNLRSRFFRAICASTESGTLRFYKSH